MEEKLLISFFYFSAGLIGSETLSKQQMSFAGNRGSHIKYPKGNAACCKYLLLVTLKAFFH